MKREMYEDIKIDYKRERRIQNLKINNRTMTIFGTLVGGTLLLILGAILFVNSQTSIDVESKSVKDYTEIQAEIGAFHKN